MHLLPTLLDRLTDDAPIVPADLRQSVLKDLEHLFNTNRLDATQNLEKYPEVTKSVVNYGLPILAGRIISSIDALKLEKLIKQTILDYEPRILPTVKVRIMKDDDQMNSSALCFEIEGELRAQPAPLFLLLRADIDMTNKTTKISDRTG